MDFLPVNALAFPGWEERRGIASSRHMIPGQWNEVHPFQEATRQTDMDGVSLGLGRFLNSENAESVYGGVKGQWGPFWAEGGLATGYSGAPVVPFGRVGMDLNDRMSVFAAPSYNVKTGDFGPVFGLNMLNWEW
jgi:hypothetical protein